MRAPAPNCLSDDRRFTVYRNGTVSIVRYPAETLAPAWIRWIVSPSSGAIESTVSLSSCFSGGIAMLFVTTTSRIGLASNRSIAGPERTGCTQVA